MKIQIRNYRNIDDLELEIIDGKTNFIYGVSGSGKSSLIRAISKEIGEQDIPIGLKRNTPIVLINEQEPCYGNARVYDDAAVEKLILRPAENEEAYDAMVGDETALNRLEEEYRNSTKDLWTSFSKMKNRQAKITQLLDVFGSREPGCDFGRRDGITKIEKEMNDCSKSTTRTLLSKDAKYLKFIIDGTKLTAYQEGRCPFCNRSLTESKTQQIENIKSATQSTFKMIFDNTDLFESLDIDEPIWTSKRSVTAFKKTLDKQLVILNALNALIEFCGVTEGDIGHYKAPHKLPVPPELLKVIPEIEDPINSINESMIAYRSLIGKMKTQFNKLVRGKIGVLNASIEQMGIPYEISADAPDRASRTIFYRIKHCKDRENMDRSEMLSSGEKNVLALLLFLEDPNGNVLLFDDPVSSYDGYRRGQLYKRIVEQKGKTIIVCSHDQSFIKQAVVDKNRKRNPNKSIGRTIMLTNSHGLIEFSEIGESDFGSLRDFVLEHVQSSQQFSYFRKMMNIRLLCELDNYKNKGDKKKAAWGYTSSILHTNSRTDIIEALSNKGYTEDDMITLFNSEYGVNIDPVPTIYEKDNCSGYTVFERAIWGRELKGVDSMDKSVLNDIVHLNNSLAICLNPYMFTDYPTYIADKIKAIK